METKSNQTLGSHLGLQPGLLGQKNNQPAATDALSFFDVIQTNQLNIKQSNNNRHITSDQKPAAYQAIEKIVVQSNYLISPESESLLPAEDDLREKDLRSQSVQSKSGNQFHEVKPDTDDSSNLENRLSSETSKESEADKEPSTEIPFEAVTVDINQLQELKVVEIQDGKNLEDTGEKLPDIETVKNLESPKQESEELDDKLNLKEDSVDSELEDKKEKNATQITEETNFKEEQLEQENSKSGMQSNESELIQINRKADSSKTLNSESNEGDLVEPEQSLVESQLTKDQEATEIKSESIDGEIQDSTQTDNSSLNDQDTSSERKRPVENQHRKSDIVDSEQGESNESGSKEPVTAGETPNSKSADNQSKEVATAKSPEIAPAVHTTTSEANNSSSNQSQAISTLIENRSIQRGLLQKGIAKSESAPVDLRQVRLIQRVAKAFQVSQERQGPVRLRLNPPELGALRIEIEVQQGKMTARVETETQAARQVLMENLPQLRDRLAEMNISIDSFEVDQMQQDATNQQQDQTTLEREASGNESSHSHEDKTTEEGQGSETEDEASIEVLPKITERTINVTA